MSTCYWAFYDANIRIGFSFFFFFFLFPGEVGPITLALRAALRKDMEIPSANLTPVPQRVSAYPVPLDASVDDLLLRNATTRLQ
jgi:hypothetical protein